MSLLPDLQVSHQQLKYSSSVFGRRCFQHNGFDDAAQQYQGSRCGCQHCSCSVVLQLLAAGAKPQLIDTDGLTALLLACSKGHTSDKVALEAEQAKDAL